MTPSLEGLPTKAKEAPSPHEVRLPNWTPTQYFNVSRIRDTKFGMNVSDKMKYIVKDIIERYCVKNEPGVFFCIYILP